nr:beta-1,6-N-acetylglucosaminyltransferase [Advenella sp. FME57]
MVAHEAPESLKPLIESVLSAGSDIFAHHDARSSHSLEDACSHWGLDALPGKIYFAKRVKVVWGEWSIIQATLNCLYLAREKNYNCDYLMLISGSCMPVKPIKLLEQHLAQDEVDHIEVVNARDNRWITDGIQEERWELFHFFNWRYQTTLFNWGISLQKKWKVKRQLPLSQIPHMGSQWWCLRKSTIERILTLIDSHPELTKFYKRSWIPDELFFQTQVGNLIPKTEIDAAPLTRYQFNSWGIPRVYYEDDLAELIGEELFFARKVSHRAPILREHLKRIGAMLPNEYADYLDNECDEYKVELFERIKLLKEMESNRWYNLVSFNENEYDYIKSIPNPVVIICSNNQELKESVKRKFAALPDAVVYGDILDPEQITFNEGTPQVAGYKSDSVKLAQHKWQLYIGSLVFRSKGKTLVFTLNDSSRRFLEVFRWKENATVLLLDEDAPENEKIYLDALCFNAQTSRFMRKGYVCEFARINETLLNETVQRLGHRLNSVDALCKGLLRGWKRKNWYSVSDADTNQYDLIKSLTKRMIVICSSDAATRIRAIDYIKQKTSARVFHDIFNTVRKGDLRHIWQYYLSDLVSDTQEDVLVFSIDLKDLNYIDVLRWSQMITLVYMNSEEDRPQRKIDRIKQSDLSNIGEVFKLKTDNNQTEVAKAEFNRLLQERLCQYYQVDPGSMHQLEDVLIKVFYGNEKNYVKSIINPIVVVYAYTKAQQESVPRWFGNLPDAALCGNLIESPTAFAKNGATTMSSDIISLMDIPWYIRVGQFAHKEKNKTLIFILDDDQDIAYLDILKFKDNLTVISLDENHADIQDGLRNLYSNCKLSVGLGKAKDAECNYIRVKEKVIDEVSARRDIVSTVGFCYDLQNASADTYWPSLSSFDHDHYEFIKQVPNDMIVVAALHGEDRKAVSKFIRDNASDDCVVLNDIFDVVPSKERLRVWPYYLGDLAAAYAGKKLIFTLDLRFQSFLEVLRWKSNLALIVVDSKARVIDLVDSEYKYRIYQEEDKRDSVRLNSMLRDRHCHLIRIPSSDQSIVAKALADVFHFSQEAPSSAGFLQAS